MRYDCLVSSLAREGAKLTRPVACGRVGAKEAGGGGARFRPFRIIFSLEYPVWAPYDKGGNHARTETEWLVLRLGWG